MLKTIKLLLFVFTVCCAIGLNGISRTTKGKPVPPDTQVKEWDEGVSQEHQLDALLNCKPFGHIMELLKEAQRDLLSYFPAKSLGSESFPKKGSHIQNRRARLWIRKLHEQMQGIFRSCLPSTSFRNILKAHQDEQDKDLLRNTGSVSVNDRVRHILSTSKPKDINNAVATQQNTNSNFIFRSTRRRKPARNSLRLTTSEIRTHRRKVASLGNELLRMLSRNKEIDVVAILHGLIALNADEDFHTPPQLNNSNGEKVIAEIGSLIREVPPYFLSVGLGPKVIQHGKLSEVTGSTRVRTLAHGLSPAVLRMGGSAANFLTYSPTNFKDLSSSSYEIQENNAPIKESIANNNVSDPIQLLSERDVPDIADANILPHTSSGVGISYVGAQQRGHDDVQGSDDVYDASSDTQRTPQENSGHVTKVDNSFSLSNDEANLGIHETSYMGDSKGCPFDSKWHSHYKTKPQMDSTYDLLSAIASARDAPYSHMQDQPSALDTSSCGAYSHEDFQNFTMTADDWATLTDFAEAVEMKLLFDLSQFYRTPEDDWDPSNARMIILAAAARNDSVIWQLGNEPDAYRHKFGFNITALRVAQDFHQLQDELTKYFQQPAIVGPDVTRPKHPVHLPKNGKEEKDIRKAAMLFLEEFLRNLDVDLTALSWHQYYVNGRNTSLDDFISVEVLDQLSWQIPQVVELRDHLAPDTPIWLTETSSAWGGGAPDLSNRYVAGFLWLDKLGLAAVHGIDMVIRNTLVDGCYALVDTQFNPNPDYWLSLLFKKLVGEGVLYIAIRGTQSTTQEFPPTTQDLPTTTTRLYAHCQKSSSKSYEPGNVVIYGMNLANTTVTVKLEGMLHSNHTIEQYLLEPSQGLQSSEVMLNGEVLQMTSEEELPRLEPLILPKQEFHLPPFTFGFWVINRANLTDCI